MDVNVTVLWEEDEEVDECRYPSVQAGEVLWEAHHGVGPDTDQVDGHIDARTLDLWFIDGPGVDDIREAYPELQKQAHDAWDSGSVLYLSVWPDGDSGIPSLILPGACWDDETVRQAFARWKP